MNKPVAWMMKAREPSLHSPDYITFETPTRDMKVSHHPYPLYTHPVKELSGVEIIGMSGKYDFSYDVDIIDFARAILRKAQEK